ncbi:MAG: CPBP family intramembrane metalloprotease [Armatimonadetes bacterium]|nr:CPBP family intramembrane metalloprotease [Armatimonadota bacterium]
MRKSSNQVSVSAQFWIVALSGVLILLYLWFDARGAWIYERYILANNAALLWIPSLIILLLFRQPMEAYGLGLGDGRKSRAFTLWMCLAMIPLLFIASRMGDFQKYYPIYRRFGSFSTYPPYPSPLLNLLYFEMSYGFYLFCWEFFFRGYLLNGMKPRIGWWAVPVQALAFGLMHYGKPMPEMLLSFVGGSILGWVALECRSTLPCFGIHWFISVLLDIFVLQSRGWRIVP